MNVAISVINARFIVGLLRDRHDSRAFDVLQVSPADAYFQHFLRVHAVDISRTHRHTTGCSLTTWRSRSSGATRPSGWCWSGVRATWLGCSWRVRMAAHADQLGLGPRRGGDSYVLDL